MTRDETLSYASLAGQAVLYLVMLGALFSHTPPFPPAAFAPSFAAALAAAILAAALIRLRSRWFAAPALLVLTSGLISFGPHKLYPGESVMFAQTPTVYPVILVGTTLLLVQLVAGWRLYRAF